MLSFANCLNYILKRGTLTRLGLVFTRSCGRLIRCFIPTFCSLVSNKLRPDITLSDDFELEHIYRDQNPEFFIGKGIKPGIARGFVENTINLERYPANQVPLLQ